MSCLIQVIHNNRPYISTTRGRSEKRHICKGCMKDPNRVKNDYVSLFIFILYLSSKFLDLQTVNCLNRIIKLINEQHQPF